MGPTSSAHYGLREELSRYFGRLHRRRCHTTDILDTIPIQMKQSQIEDAIERDAMPLPLNTYKIYGHSDDIVTIDGPNISHKPTSGIELYPEKFPFHFYAIANDLSPLFRITALLVHDQWQIGISPIADDVPLPIGEYSLSVEGYSAVLTITTAESLNFVEV